MKRTGPTNPIMQRFIQDLKIASAKENAPIWKRIAYELERPTRKRRIVNLSKINRFGKEGAIIVVPGKVLGSGELTKRFTIAAWQFSESAKKKIKKANGAYLMIQELLKDHPKGRGLLIIG